MPVAELAEKYGTPLYVYSQATLLHHLKQIQTAFAEAEPLICYCVKTNGNLRICRLMAEHGAGFDVTSGGELYRALKAGGDRRRRSSSPASARPTPRCATPSRTASSSSTSRARRSCTPSARWPKSMGKVAPVALRVNPDLPPKTHAKTDTSRQGRQVRPRHRDGPRRGARASSGIPDVAVVGLHMHLGSPILNGRAVPAGRPRRASTLIEQLRAAGARRSAYLNMGGGFGINYRKQEAPPASAFAEVIVPGREGDRLPARAGAGPVHRRQRRHPASAACMFTKESGGKHYVIQDAAMNDLIRPTLYDSFHRIWPVEPGGRTCRRRRRTTRPTIPGHVRRRTWSARCASRATSWRRTGTCRR